MKIGIISDLHLGFRQYGSIERETDFYNQFYLVCLEMSKHDLDAVIIAGDLFNTPNPSPAAIHTYREGIKSLDVSMIFAIKGNHTMVMRDNHYSIDEFFGKNEFQNYYLLDDCQYKDNNIAIDGITYRNNSSKEEFLAIQKMLAEKKTLSPYRILVVHQSFNEFCGFMGEDLSITDIDYEPYDLIVCGHIHSRTDVQINKDTLFIQPGSIERMNTTEAKDEEKNGKGFYVVDTETKSYDFHRVECPRKFFLGDIDIDKDFSITDFYRKLVKKASKLKVAPIISYKFHNHTDDIAGIRDIILDKKENILIDNSSIYDEVERDDILVEITDTELPTVAKALKIGLEKSLNDKDAEFALDLYNLLKDDADGIDIFLDEYYKERVPEEEEIEISYDEIDELERFFKNLGGV